MISASYCIIVLRVILRNVDIPVTVAFPTPYPNQPPELVYADAVLAADWDDPTGTFPLPAGTTLGTTVGAVTNTGFTAPVTTIDGKPNPGAKVHLFYAAFEFAD